MKRSRLSYLLNKWPVIPVVVAAFALGFLGLLTIPVSGWAQQGCIGWNCDGKNPCTGMGCGESSPSAGPSKETKTGSTQSTGTGTAKSGATKNSKASSNSTKVSSKNTKAGPS